MLLRLQRVQLWREPQANLASKWNSRLRSANSGRWVVLASTETLAHLLMDLKKWRKELTSLGITRRNSANVSTRSSTALMARAANSYITRCPPRRKRSLLKLLLSSLQRIWSRWRRPRRHSPTQTTCYRQLSSSNTKPLIVVSRSSLRFQNRSAIALYRLSETRKTSLLWQNTASTSSTRGEVKQSLLAFKLFKCGQKNHTQK